MKQPSGWWFTAWKGLVEVNDLSQLVAMENTHKHGVRMVSINEMPCSSDPIRLELQKIEELRDWPGNQR